MNTKRDLEIRVMMAARENNISSILFRNSIRSRVGLNITDSECLSFLSIKGVLTPKDISHYTGLTTGSTTAMLDRLENAQFIRRKPNPDDRRGALIEIHEKWIETSRPLVVGLQKEQAELIASYSDAELEIIADFLTRFTDNVKKYTEMIEQDLI
ncbi:MAG: MarR family transcriptional regulator [bacterium]|nr:MarR family transcriptional regulator [bacterium]